MSSNLQSSRRIANNALALYVRMFVMMLISLYTVRVVLKVLGVEEYGVYTAIGGVVSTFSFLSSVLANASQRFFSYQLGLEEREDSKQINLLFNTMFVAYLLVSIIVILLAESIGFWFVFNKMIIPDEHITAAHWIFQFSLFGFVLTLLTTPFKAIIIAVEKMGLFAYFSIFEALLKLLIVFLLLCIDIEKLKAYAVLTFLSTTIVSLLYIYESTKICKLSLNFSCDKVFLRSIFSYSSWTVFGTLSGVLTHQGINILLNLFIGPLANAAYAISSKVSMTVQHFSSNFYTAVRPPLIKSYSRNDYAFMKKLYYLSSKALFSLVFVFLMPLYFVTETILNIWLGQVGDYMIEFTRLSLIYTLILTLNNPISTIAQAANKVKLYHGLCDSITLLALPISYLIMKYDCSPSMPYLVTIIVFLVAHFIRLYVVKRIVGFLFFDYLVKIIIPITFTIISASILTLFVKQFVPCTLLGDIILGIFSFIVSCISVFVIMLGKDEKQLLLKMIKRNN